MIERRMFGRTGHESSRTIFGAAALGAMTQEQADAVLPVLLEFGVNHLDTAASYGDAELRLAPWLAAHPGRFFLATKTGERTGPGARAELERSLQRLGVDHVDMIQLHNLVEEEEWQTAHGPGGALEALLTAREEGLVRFIGVTGHGLRIAAMHRRSLRRFDYDAVLLPYNYSLSRLDEYRHELEALAETCAARGVALQTIKSLARSRWADESGPRHSWYRPLEDADAIGRAVRFVLGRPDTFLNTSSDARRLRPTLVAAEQAASEGWVHPSLEEMEADVTTLGISPLFDGADLERI